MGGPSGLRGGRRASSAYTSEHRERVGSNPHPTRSCLPLRQENYINALVADTQPGDEIIFCFSGHGSANGRRPLAPLASELTTVLHIGLLTIDGYTISPQVSLQVIYTPLRDLTEIL